MSSSSTNNSTEFLGIKSNLSLGSDGLSSGLGGALFESKKENEYGDKINTSLLKVGAKADLNSTGVDVGAAGKVIRKEVVTENVTIGTGLNFDTGVKLGRDGVKMELLGFGFSAGKDGTGFKLPFFDMKFKK